MHTRRQGSSLFVRKKNGNNSRARIILNNTIKGWARSTDIPTWLELKSKAEIKNTSIYRPE